MQEIEIAGHQFLGVEVLEGRLVATHFHQGMLESGLYSVFCCHLFQGFGVFGHSEHHCVCFDKLDFDGEFFLLPFVSPKVQNLLWSTCTFYGQCWLSENRLS